jgi:hypothetical protein
MEQSPRKHRAFESPLLADPPASADRSAARQRGRSPRWLMLLAGILVAAIVVLIVLL